MIMKNLYKPCKDNTKNSGMCVDSGWQGSLLFEAILEMSCNNLIQFRDCHETNSVH